MRFVTLSTILTLTPLISGSVVVLTDDNFADATNGKIAFVKFFAPWCGHCKEMAPDWVKLAYDFKDDANIIIAEVDCTAEETEEICQAQGIEGFPTLKYGDSFWMEAYEGARDYEALLDFSRKGLKQGCSPVNTELCSEDQKKKIEEIMAMSADDLEAIINKLDDSLEADEDAFDKTTDVLESSYEELVNVADAAKKEAKTTSDYNILKAVQAFHQKNSGGDEL